MAGRCDTTRFVLRRAILSHSGTAVGCFPCCGGGATTVTVVVFAFGALTVGAVLTGATTVCFAFTSAVVAVVVVAVPVVVAASVVFAVGADGFVGVSCAVGGTGAYGAGFVVCTRPEGRVGGAFSHRKIWQKRDGRYGFKKKHERKKLHG